MTEPVRYYIRASTELLRHPENWHQPDGWRIVREVGPVDQYTVLCEVEDDGAPADLAGHAVVIVMEGRYAADGTQIGAVVSYRELDQPFDTGFQVAYQAGRESWRRDHPLPICTDGEIVMVTDVKAWLRGERADG